jgi:peptide/nickel transport system permease protein
MLQLLFSMQLDLLPLRGRLGTATAAPPHLTGLFVLDSLLTGRLDTLRDALRHLALPAITLSLGAMATITRFTRSGVLETMQKEYVLYEVAAGYPRWLLIAVYVLRNSLVATITQIGLLFGALLAGAVVVESIFDWPGIGSYAVTAIFTSDYKAILAVTLLVGVVYSLVNIAVDLVHGVIDPRVAAEL